MSNLNTLPLEDGFSTSLAQEWNGATGTVYVNAVPSFTFPSGVTTYIVANPTKSNMQIGEINAYSAVNNTLTVTNITLEKGASVNSTAEIHAVNSKVIISDNYQFWKDIQTAINSKMNLDDDNIVTAGKTTFTSTSESQIQGQNVTTTQRDALTGVQNGDWIYNTTLGQTQWREGGAWVSNAAGGTVADATETVAGKIELATDAEITAGTDTGGTGASVVVIPGQIKKSISLKASATTSDEADEYVFNDAGEDKRITKANLRDDLAASNTIKGTVEMATDSEATAGTDETRYINSKQAKDNYGINGIIDGRSDNYTTETSDTLTIAMGTTNFKTVRFGIVVSQKYASNPLYMKVGLYGDFICGTTASVIEANSIFREAINGGGSQYTIGTLITPLLSISKITSTVSHTVSSDIVSITGVYRSGSDLKIQVSFNDTDWDSKMVQISAITIIN